MELDRSETSGSLAPGFRFHPTDEELVSYYLKRKVCGKPFRFDAISDVDVYKTEPWDLPGKSRLKTRDLEWYFFSVLDKKYGNGSRTNRATERGYWKTTGKDRAVLHRTRTVGMKKTLVYHNGRAPRGDRTNWVMHEYRLVDETLEKSGIFQDAFVLCRIFQKSGSGPKNGEQYGAPFVEEEWENDALVVVPGEEARGKEAADDDSFLDANDIEQILGTDIPSGNVPVPFFYYGDSSTNVPDPLDFIDDAQKLLLSMGESYYAPDQPEDKKLLDFPGQNYVDAVPVKQEYVGESSNGANAVDPDYLNAVDPDYLNAMDPDYLNAVDPDFLLDEPFFDVTNNQLDKGEYLETGDLSNTILGDPSYLDMVEEYLTFYDAENGNSQYMPFDTLDMMGSENPFSDQSCLTQEHLNGGAQQESMGSQQLWQGLENDAALSSEQELEKLGSGNLHPLTKQVNRKLGSIPAPPAFASEFPTKEAALLLSSSAHSSSPTQITAGMIQISNMTANGNRAYWSFGKNSDVNIVLSFGLSPDDPNPTKAGTGVPRCWLYMFFVWVLILSVSCRIGTYFYTGNAA
ncbi:NAC domain-containing protein 53-like isoform X1 [Rhododendron vialii]|uniref:NAC domain-containing protein 53-like isoform X1 n=1 Tax=Rhododendron vialii TaxID=182163 RepID=UPI00265DD82D|nr:NAC domain-containing protein 53-like isoform X1 [Rhododendron vialii]